MHGKGLKLNFEKFSATTNEISKEFEQFTLTRQHFVDKFNKRFLHNGQETLSQSRTSEEDSFECSYTSENEDQHPSIPPAHKKKRIEAHELPALQKQSNAKGTTSKSETNNEIEATSSFYKRLEKGDKFIKGKTALSFIHEIIYALLFFLYHTTPYAIFLYIGSLYHI